MVSSAPPITIGCCRCGKRLPKSVDVYVLDDEWARRYPAMTGRIACWNCSLGDEWQCIVRGGAFVRGHVPSRFAPASRDFDSWSHVSEPHTLAAVVRAWPELAVSQGAESYVRWIVERWGRGIDSSDPAAALRELQRRARQG